jgi:hypothetical protein
MGNKSNETIVTNPELREEEIRLAAYYLWKEKGENQGSDTEDWLEAEESLND